MRKAWPLLLILLLIACGGLRSKQREAAITALSSLRKLQASTQVGVNYNNYGQLLVDAKTKVNDASRILPDGDLKTELNAAMDGYSDAAHVWNFKIQNDGVFYERGEPKPIIDKYGLREILRKADMLPGDNVVQVIWEATKPHLERAEKLLN